MTFPANAYFAAFFGALIAASISFPLWRRFCFTAGLIDDPGPRKIHQQTIPLAGGLTVMTGILFPLLAGWIWLSAHSYQPPAGFVAPHPQTQNSQAVADNSPDRDPIAGYLLKYGFNRRVLELVGILFGALGMLAVGCLDDRFELKPLAKFGGQFVIAAAVAACGVRVTLFVPNPIFSYVITILWILTVVNAFNFMDNMNGLCAGLGAVGAGLFGSIAAAKGQYLVASFAFASTGALLGFLPFNFPQAKAFLGDGGSHLVGYLLAILGILPHFHTSESPNRLAVLTPLLVLAVPLFDLAWVVLLRWRIGQPFYQGDTNHLSHRLVKRGYGKTTAVLLIWLMAICAGSISLFL